ncbi:FAD-binding oxidoreductase [Tropicibacter sp. Alg240-R139]|uniref:NAD(P)/FAD-dependent oxidoreductase n=1 Tax=Tropicibacter sp. Alg240-R139 TaxID=2305991 RepID=UPI0013DF6F17|nr:FAD-binding oxidoreductase [Tropicibacter sp. Alg240-R139]
MPGPRLTEFYSDLAVPKKVDVVVIGGGIIGVSTALELADRGVSVLLCEKGQIGAEQSSRNWGWVRLGMRDPREIPLMVEAIRMWHGLDERLGRKTGYTQSGIVFGASGKRDLAGLERWAEHVAGLQVGDRIARGVDLDDVLAGHRTSLTGGLYMPGDGRAEPQWAAPAIAEGARDRGASILTGCAVRSVDVQGGKVAGVITERGRVTCDRVVLAGGAWSRLFAGNAGIDLPQLKVMNTVMRTSPVKDGPEVALWSDKFAIRKRADGGYSIASGHENTVDLVPDSLRLAWSFLPAFRQEWRSLRFRLSKQWLEEARQDRRWSPTDVTPFEQCRILDPEPSEKVLRNAWSSARKAFPALESAEIVQSWAGMIDVTPDAIPVISQVADLPGMHIATGFSGHGFGIGPGAGQLMADLVTGASPLVDPWEFRLSRFTDGARVAPDPGY